jgi:hypothetical protein
MTIERARIRAVTMRSAAQAGLLLAALALGGCSGEPAADPTPTTTSTPSPTPTAPMSEEEAVAAADATVVEMYRLWDEVVKENPDDPSAVTAVARDMAMSEVERLQKDQVDSGYTIQDGAVEWTIREEESYASPMTFAGEELPFGAVTIVGCADYRSFAGTNADGSALEVDNVWKNRLSVTYWPDEERWYVTDITTMQDESDQCRK